MLLAVSLWVATTSANAQDLEEPASPPPLFTEHTHDEVERLLAHAPPGPPSGRPPGLRVFTISHIEPAEILALIVAGCASLFLAAPGAYLVYASLDGRQSSSTFVQGGLAVLAVLSLAWILLFYSLAFTRNAHSYDVLEKEIVVIDRSTAPGSIFIGDLSRAGFRGLSSQWTAGKVRYPLRRLGDRVPEVHFATFQLALFLLALAPLLVVTGRVLRSWSQILFWLLWGGLVYAPVTYWTQGGGWLAESVDAGSAVPLHICVGFTALGLMLHQRRLRADSDVSNAATPNAGSAERPVYLAIGTVLFVSGNLLLAGGRSLALHPWATFDWLNLLLAACVGLLVWMALEHRAGNSDPWIPLLGTVSGISALAAGSSSIAPGFAILIALVASAASYFLVRSWKEELHEMQNAWRIFAIQGVSALIGLVLTGVFATTDIAGVDASGRPIIGWIGGNWDLWRVQLLTGSLVGVVALAAGFFLPKVSSLAGRLFAWGSRGENRAELPIVAKD